MKTSKVLIARRAVLVLGGIAVTVLFGGLMVAMLQAAFEQGEGIGIVIFACGFAAFFMVLVIAGVTACAIQMWEEDA